MLLQLSFSEILVPSRSYPQTFEKQNHEPWPCWSNRRCLQCCNFGISHCWGRFLMCIYCQFLLYCWGHGTFRFVYVLKLNEVPESRSLQNFQNISLHFFVWNYLRWKVDNLIWLRTTKIELAFWSIRHLKEATSHRGECFVLILFARHSFIHPGRRLPCSLQLFNCRLYRSDSLLQ